MERGPGWQALQKKEIKISLFDKDWKKLETIAAYYKKEEGINVSSGQIAAALLHNQISKIGISLLEIKKLKDKSRKDSEIAQNFLKANC